MCRSSIIYLSIIYYIFQLQLINYNYQLYIWECCLFVRGKCQNYGTDWRQTYRNYEEWPGKCPLWIEIARLSVLGKIVWHFRFFLCGRPPFLTFLFQLLPRCLTQSAFAKTASTVRHSLLYMYCVPRMLFILKHYIKELAYCMHAIINISPIVYVIMHLPVSYKL